MHLNLQYFMHLNKNDILKIVFSIKQFVNKHILNQYGFFGIYIYMIPTYLPIDK
jgi:hypothetical protein